MISHMELFSFEKLRVYEVAEELVEWVYTETSDFPSAEKYALSNQLQRAIVSVTSNIAEGCGRKSYKEKVHYIEIAYGSLLETYSQLRVANRLGYTDTDKLNTIRDRFFDASRLLIALRHSYEKELDT